MRTTLSSHSLFEVSRHHREIAMYEARLETETNCAANQAADTLSLESTAEYDQAASLDQQAGAIRADARTEQLHRTPERIKQEGSLGAYGQLSNCRVLSVEQVRYAAFDCRSLFSVSICSPSVSICALCLSPCPLSLSVCVL